MRLRKWITIAIVALVVSLGIGIASFLYNANASYTVDKGFESVPLQFDPYESTSDYTWESAQVRVKGGFVKGLQRETDGSQSLVIRALSPLPSIQIEGKSQKGHAIRLENINPESYALSISESKSMNHGFQDPDEALKFESLMQDHGVDTVYLSHIHSHFDFMKDDVHYIITGGAGAELLASDSYYHYMVTGFDGGTNTLIELPSPANAFFTRYLAAASLFAKAMYAENPVSVVFLLLGLGIFLILLVLRIYLWKQDFFQLVAKGAGDTGRFGIKRYKELWKVRKEDQSNRKR